jgi:hypothetical protein
MTIHRIAATPAATADAQRRGVPGWVASLLLQEGARTAAGAGRLYVFFDGASRARIQRRARRGEFQMSALDHVWNVFAVVTRGKPTLISVGHRTRPMHRR